LESEFPILFNIGQSAEFNLHQDEVYSFFKIRQIGEQVTEYPILTNTEIGKSKKFLNYHIDKIESQYQSLKAKIDQLPQAVLAKAFRGELVGQEVKEYVREIEELGMVAEGINEYQNSSHLKSE
jgi:hypothetical protein